jgi:branched-chain amino acid transport system substrate-binding protein
MRLWVVVVLASLAGCATLRGPAPVAPGPGEPAPSGTEPPRQPGPEADVAAAVTRLGHGEAAAARTLVGRYAGSGDVPAAGFVLGVAESRLGNGRRALALLQPFASSGAPPLPGATAEEGTLMLHAALAEARALTGDIVGALGEWDRYYQVPGVRDAEKAFARSRAEALGGRLSAEAALAAVRTTEAPLARAAIGARAAAALRTQGDADGARRLDEEATSLRKSLGFEGAAPWLGPGDPSRLGLAVPLSGRFHVLGEVALRGAMLAIGEPGPQGEAAPFQILVRDTASSSGDRADLRTAELVREEAVIGIVGVGDRRAIDQTARDGVPFLVLEEQTPGRQSTAFQLIHGPEARAAELARRALALGARNFAVVGPATPAAGRLVEAFRRSAAAGGGRIVVQASYPAGSSSFSGPLAPLRRASFDAVFVPDDADRLELVAPALAVIDVWSRPAGPRSPPAAGASPRREVLLLSTAVGLSRRLVRNAGRYVQGALLAPGFCAATDDPRSARFVARFRQLYAQDPSATDAYGFDGMRLLRGAVERGARTRADVLRLLASESRDGVTGAVKFGPDHTRVDPPPVYTVEGNDLRPAP